MAALVAALVIQASDRTPWLASSLGSRFGKPGQVVVAAALALALGNGLAVVAGILIAGHLSPNARDLLLAFALLSAGVSAFWPIKPPKAAGNRLGAFVASFVGVALLGFGDRTQFVTAALAARSTTPALAAVGAVIGTLVVTVPAILIGEAKWRRLPLAAIRIACGVPLVIVGVVQGLGAVRLI